jgi:hypothetical protein
MIAWVRIHGDPYPLRTVIIPTKRTNADMIRNRGNKGLVIFWHTELVGWIVCWQ